MEATRVESTHLNLRWEDHKHTFTHLLDHYRLEGLYCDASLACAGGAAYSVHQLVLSAASDFFASLFASASCQNPVVVLQDVRGEELEALLTYIYRGQVLLPRHTLPGFLKVAGSLQVKGLSSPPLTQYADTWGSSAGELPSSDPGVSSPVSHLSQFHPSSHPLPPPPPPYPHSELINLPERCTEAWSEDAGLRSAAPLPASARGVVGGQRGGDSQRPLRKRFSPNFGRLEPSCGTFQNLVTSDEERGIKEEPSEEEMDLYNAERLSTYEKEEEEAFEEEERMEEDERKRKDRDEEEKRGRKEEEEQKEQKEKEGLMEEVKEEEEEEYEEENKEEKEEIRREERKLLTPMSAPSTPLPPSPTHFHPSLSPTPGHPALPPLPATPAPHPSQLRRELLKPLHGRPLTAPPPSPHSIPHSVITNREGEGAPRELPPLVKLPSSPTASAPPLNFAPLHHHHHHHHHPHIRSPGQNDERDRDGTTTTITPTSTTTTTKTHHHHHHHLLVNTQPTYRTRHAHAAPTQMPHLPATYLPALTPVKVPSVVYDDTPLNLSQDHHPQQPQNPRQAQGSVVSDRRVRDSRDPFLGKILTNRKRRMRGPKSWEYLVRLLRDPTTNPSLIRWENEGRAVFRLVQPAIIAQRWGRRTGKHASECLSYENFARGLRYHYATGALQPVSERSFVYKFGPKALQALGDDAEYAVTGAASPDDAMMPSTTSATSVAAASATAAAMTRL